MFQLRKRKKGFGQISLGEQKSNSVDPDILKKPFKSKLYSDYLQKVCFFKRKILVTF